MRQRRDPESASTTPATPTIRLIRPDDSDSIESLYADLSPEDKHRRFFSPFVPPRDRLVAWASLTPPEGVGVVAEVTLTDGTREIVGHADCHRLANGDAELAVTVAARWRGGLGRRLVDVLLEEAAAIGFPNLEAELFVANRPMHALLAARGAVTTGRPDVVFERVMVSTTGGVPTWPSLSPHPRLLIEHPGWPGVAERLSVEGWSVIVCPGPERRAECPALLGTPCPLAEAADVIALASDASSSALQAAHARLHAAPCVIGAEGDTSAVTSAIRRAAGHELTTAHDDAAS